MPDLRRHLLGLAAFAASTAAAGSAAAQVPPAVPCITFGQSTLNATYNPFNAGGLTVANLTLTVHRWNAAQGGGKTQSAGFIFLTQPNQPAGIQMTYQGQNVIYAPPGPGGLPTTSQGAAGQLYASFGGNAQSDTQTVNIQVALTLPPGVDLHAGNSDLELDVKYACQLTGVGNNPSSVSGVVPNALKINVDVVSALRARYAGPALAFGEIGLVNAPPGTPDRLASKQVVGQFHVDSSGPYEVAFRSENGYRLSVGPGPNENVPYELSFLGHTVGAATGTATTTVSCARAGLSPGRDLPVSAEVQEGWGKTPSLSYRDTLHVTFTPKATPSGAPSAACS